MAPIRRRPQQHHAPLKQFSTVQQEGDSLERLVPNPPRCCSRQTGVIVTRNYDMGCNPYYVSRRDRGGLNLEVLEKKLDKRAGNVHRAVTGGGSDYHPPEGDDVDDDVDLDDDEYDSYYTTSSNSSCTGDSDDADGGKGQEEEAPDPAEAVEEMDGSPSKKRVTYHAAAENEETSESLKRRKNKEHKKKHFKPKRSSSSSNAVPTLPNIPKYRRAAGILAKATTKPTETVDQLIAKLPSLKKEDDRRKARKAALQRHQHFLEKPKPFRPQKRDGMADYRDYLSMEEGTGDEEDKVHSLIKKVLAFKAPEEEAHLGGNGDGHHHNHGGDHSSSAGGGKTTMSGLKIAEEDPARSFSIEQYRLHHLEFERFQLEGKFMGALSMKTPIIFMNLLITPDMIRKSIDVNLEMNFLELMKSAMLQVNREHLQQLADEFARAESDRMRKASNFRDKYNLATVRDIERCFEQMLRRFSKKQRLSKHTRERGVTEDEYVRFCAQDHPTLTEEEVRVVFREHAVEPLTTGGGGGNHSAKSRRGTTAAPPGMVTTTITTTRSSGPRQSINNSKPETSTSSARPSLSVSIVDPSSPGSTLVPGTGGGGGGGGATRSRRNSSFTENTSQPNPGGRATATTTPPVVAPRHTVAEQSSGGVLSVGLIPVSPGGGLTPGRKVSAASPPLRSRRDTTTTPTDRRATILANSNPNKNTIERRGTMNNSRTRGSISTSGPPPHELLITVDEFATIIKKNEAMVGGSIYSASFTQVPR